MVISVWDLSRLRYRGADFQGLLDFLKFKVVLGAALRKAQRIIAHSHSIKQELVSQFKLPPEKISVIYPALSQIEKTKNPTFRSINGYVTYIGSTDKRKNLPLLLKAYKIAHTQGIKNKLALRISLTKDDRAHLLQQLIELKIPTDQVLLYDTVMPLNELQELYKKSAILAFPSLYEGFGLPLLEAMNASLPIVALDRGTIAEVVSTSGILVANSDPASFSSGILQALSKEDTYNELCKSSFARSKFFCWDIAVNKTFSIYNSIIEDLYNEK
jgi:glycosyltransferase involved in cell wall biosynthesis